MADRTIRIKEETYARLAGYGKFGDTADNVINNILDALEKKSKKAGFNMPTISEMARDQAKGY